MLRHSISKVSEHYLASMDMEKMWEIKYLTARFDVP